MCTGPAAVKAPCGVAQDPDSLVDHLFVLAKLPDASAELEAALVAEQSAHGDILEVECQENCLNNGKTYLTFKRIYELVSLRACLRMCASRAPYLPRLTAGPDLLSQATNVGPVRWGGNMWS